jgi:hypothetical protein
VTLEELERYDPRAAPGKHRRRFACPFCGDGKPCDKEHRSLSVEVDSGLYKCWRCQKGGKLESPWQARLPRVRKAKVWGPPPRMDEEAPPCEPHASGAQSADWRAMLRDVRPLAWTPGASYLAGRGLEAAACHQAGVRFLARWFGRPAVMFPIRDHHGGLVAVQGRFTDHRMPKTMSRGSVSLGVFATPDAWEADPLIFVEGPIDALTLWTAGYPAVALMGCSMPEWIPSACAGKRVAVASDFDRPDSLGVRPGERAARRWITNLCQASGQIGRLRAPEGRDWNDLWVLGRDDLKRAVSELVGTWLSEVGPRAILDSGASSA